MAEDIGIVGGGQLGRMLTEAALPMGFGVVVIDPTENCPAAQAGAEQIQAPLTDPEAAQELARRVDVVTWEIEHINPEALEGLDVDVEPSPRTLRIIMDKLQQKRLLRAHGIPVADFMSVASETELENAFSRFGRVILKTRTGGYDGRGNLVVASPVDWDQAIEKFGYKPLYAEGVEDFQKELAVIIARDRNGSVVQYPVVETVHRNNICHLVLSPATIDPEIQKATEEVAHETAKHLEGAGVFAIEMFLTEEDEILVNEIAPRVHNSGHHTIEASRTSQFEQHVRAITGLPLGGTEILTPASVMINILGERDGDVVVSGLENVLALPDTHIHLYGKAPTKTDRKMGHITVRGYDLEEARLTAIKARGGFSI